MQALQVKNIQQTLRSASEMFQVEDRQNSIGHDVAERCVVESKG